MSEIPENIEIKEETQKPEKKKTTFFARTIKFLAWLFICLITFFATVTFIVFILFQFSGFRAWVLGHGLSYVNEGLKAKIEIEDIRFRSVLGLELQNVRMLAAGDTLVSSQRVFLDIDIWGLLNNKINIRSLYLDSPIIKFVRSKSDSSWNFEHIAKEYAPSDEATDELVELLLTIDDLIIDNANLLLYDSTYTHYEQEHIDWGNIELQNLGLRLKTAINLANMNSKFNLSDMAFIEKNSGFKLLKLNLKADIIDNNVNVPLLEFQTEETDVTLKVKAENFPIFSGLDEEHLLNAPIELDLKINQVSLKDVKKIAGFETPLTDIAHLYINMSGTLSEMNLNEFQLNADNSQIKLKAKVFHPTNPEKLSYETEIVDSYIKYDDLKINMPDYIFQSIPIFDVFSIKRIHAKGRVDTVYAALDVASSLGNIKGTAGISYYDDIKFKGNLNVSSLNLSDIVKDKSLKSNINCEIVFYGRGSNPETMSASINLKAKNTKIFNYYFEEFDFISTITSGNFVFDTLNVILDKSTTPEWAAMISEGPPTLSLKGNLNLSNIKIPSYNLLIELHRINFANMFDDKNLPEFFSGSIDIAGTGFEADSLDIDLKAKLKEVFFADKALLPIETQIKIERLDEKNRNLMIVSDLMNLNLKGDFNFSNIISLVENQGSYLVHFIEDKIASLKDTESLSLSVEPESKKTYRFEPITFNLYAQINDLSVLNAFLDDAKIFCRAEFAIDMNVSEDTSILDIDSISISSFQYEDKHSKLILQPMNITSKLNMFIEDSMLHLKQLDFQLVSLLDIKYNDMEFDYPQAKIKVYEDYAEFKLVSGFNDILSFLIDGKLEFAAQQINLELDSLKISYLDDLLWSNAGFINASISHDNYDVKNLVLKRDENETITLSGKYSGDRFHNIKLNVSELDFSSFEMFIDEEILSSIRGQIEHLDINLNGSAENPEIDLSIKSSEISLNYYKAGSIEGTFAHRDGIISGELSLNDNKQTIEFFKIDVISLPLNLAFSDLDERLNPSIPVNIKVRSEKLPLAFAEPFIPVISNPSGSIDFNLDISGFAPDKIAYSGELVLNKSDFLFTVNNLFYKAEGNVSFNNDNISINQFRIENHPEDLRNGAAEVTGNISLKGFELSSLDLIINSRQLMVLSPGSLRAMPTVYGDLIVATGQMPLYIRGDLSSPQIGGDLNILGGNLILPLSGASQQAKSNAVYYMVDKDDNNIKIVKTVDISTGKTLINLIEIQNQDANNGNERSSDFVENMSLNLAIRMLNPVSVTMELGPLGMLLAKIATPDRTVPLYFVMRPGTDPRLSGEIIVEEGSKLSYIKQFETTGNISFPTGEISNPSLNLAAEYSGKSYINDNLREFKVYLYITGTKERPNIRFDYSINGESARGDSSAINQDAIFLIAIGKTKSEFESGGGGQGNDISNIGMQGLSAAFSKTATDLLQGTGYVQSAEIDIGAGDWEQARVRLSGQLFGDWVWRFGGNFADIGGNNELSIDIPLGFVIHPDFLNNIILQLSRATNVNQSTANRNQKEWEVKLKFGGSW